MAYPPGVTDVPDSSSDYAADCGRTIEAAFVGASALDTAVKINDCEAAAEHWPDSRMVSVELTIKAKVYVTDYPGERDVARDALAARARTCVTAERMAVEYGAKRNKETT